MHIGLCYIIANILLCVLKDERKSYGKQGREAVRELYSRRG
jgi:hypothetical protein